MNYRTLSDMAHLIRSNLHRIPTVDAVVGIPRSGTIAASMIASLTNQRLNDFAQSDTILLVDDSISGGQTMKRALQFINAARIITLAVFSKPSSPPVDIVLEVVPGPRVFEYNWYRSVHLRSAVLDIDGVICTETEGPLDRHNGSPLFLPAYPVLALATGRHEAERESTEIWLGAHGVRYGKLFTSNACSKGRDTKVQAILETGAKWMVESDPFQAEYIRAKTGIPVLCTGTNKMLTS